MPSQSTRAAPLSPQHDQSRLPNAVLLVAMTAVGSFSLNSFLPSIPAITREFSTDPGAAQLGLTLYLVGLAGGQLVYGPLSDRFGRRPALLAGLALGILASIVCCLAWSIETLNAARFVQALGLCAGTVLGRAIVRDCFGRDRAASTLGYLTMAMAVVPAVAPSVGGIVDEALGWRWVFGVMLSFSTAVAIWALFGLRETNRHPLAEIGILSLVGAYRRLLGNRIFLGYTLNATFTAGAFFSFLAGAPVLAIGHLKASATTFGLWFAAVSVAYMLGNFLAGRLSARLGVERMVLFGCLVATPSAAVMLLFAATLGPTLWTLFLPMLGVAIGNGISQPNAIAGAVSADPRLAGAASGLLGCVQMGGGALVTLALSALSGPTLWPLAAVMTASLMLSLPAWAAAAGKRPRQPQS